MLESDSSPVPTTNTSSSDSSETDLSNNNSSNSSHKKSRFEVIPISKEVKMDRELALKMDYNRRASRGVIPIRRNSIGNVNRAKFKRSTSVTPAMLNVPEHNLREFLGREKVPYMDHYRQSVDLGTHRPTFEELMRQGSIAPPFNFMSQHSTDSEKEDNSGKGNNVGQDESNSKLGWIKGVYVKCLLNIWGVMLFLRLTWVVGQAGLFQAVCIVTLANVVTFITSISMSAVSTNGKIKGGGIYYMLSRSLGPEFGGAIGLMMTIANAIAVAMYVIGFCGTLLDMLKEFSVVTIVGIGDGSESEVLNDTRLLGAIVMVFILIVAIGGMDWVSRVELGLLALLIIAQLDFAIGAFMNPSDVKKAKGFVGMNISILQENSGSTYRMEKGVQYNFFGVFAIFFPAVTGIVAGANFSGDLKDPATAIPKGTLAAILTTFVSYVVYIFFIASSTIREASGNLSEYKSFLNGNQTFADENNITNNFKNCTERICAFGTLNDKQMMWKMAADSGPLIYVGCFAATLSSAIASLVGAPRVFQAVAKDKLFPGISTFADGHGPNNDPLKGYFLIFFISLICVMIGDLDAVSALLSNFFVASYALMNFAVFHVSVTHNPGWRPSFKYYNKWLSLFGTIICIAVMFLMDPTTALVTFLIVFLLYVYIKSRHLNTNWGSSMQSQYFITALKSVQSLTKIEDHVKNYRPKLIIFCGDPSHRPSLGAQAAIDFCGLGKLSPNMALLGFHEKWFKDPQTSEDYFQTLVHAFNNHLSIGVLRIRGGLDLIRMADSENILEDDNIFSIQIASGQPQDDPGGIASNQFDCDTEDSEGGVDDSGFNHVELRPCGISNMGYMSSESDEKNFAEPSSKTKLEKVISNIHWPKHGGRFLDMIGGGGDNHRRPSTHSILSVEMFEKARIFRSKKKLEGTIDVYWLYDDGGLTLLLPYILSTRTLYRKSRLRIFFLSNKVENIDKETRNMAELMVKFRIECTDIVAISDATNMPAKHTRDAFLKMIEEEVGHEVLNQQTLRKFAQKINFNLRLSEIVRQTSCTSNLVVMTLPVPKKDNVPTALYLSLLDFITRDMPPFFLVRGNQDSVLTFYS